MSPHCQIISHQLNSIQINPSQSNSHNFRSNSRHASSYRRYVDSCSVDHCHVPPPCRPHLQSLTAATHHPSAAQRFPLHLLPGRRRELHRHWVLQQQRHARVLHEPPALSGGTRVGVQPGVAVAVAGAAGGDAVVTAPNTRWKTHSK